MAGRTPKLDGRKALEGGRTLTLPTIGGAEAIPRPRNLGHYGRVAWDQGPEARFPCASGRESWDVGVHNADARHNRHAYPGDLTSGQWAVIAPMIAGAAPGGRPRRAPKREIVEAVLYFLRAGCSWRLLPHDFPPWRTVYHHLLRWEREGGLARVHHTPVMAGRERAGRAASPCAANIYSQTVRTADQKGAQKAMARGDRGPGGAA
jgi:transposase